MTGVERAKMIINVSWTTFPVAVAETIVRGCDSIIRRAIPQRSATWSVAQTLVQLLKQCGGDFMRE
jgi:hypothetical protein